MLAVALALVVHAFDLPGDLPDARIVDLAGVLKKGDAERITDHFTLEMVEWGTTKVVLIPSSGDLVGDAKRISRTWAFPSARAIQDDCLLVISLPDKKAVFVLADKTRENGFTQEDEHHLVIDVFEPKLAHDELVDALTEIYRQTIWEVSLVSAYRDDSWSAPLARGVCRLSRDHGALAAVFIGIPTIAIFALMVFVLRILGPYRRRFF